MLAPHEQEPSRLPGSTGEQSLPATHVDDDAGGIDDHPADVTRQRRPQLVVRVECDAVGRLATYVVQALGRRDRAILETMYSAGTRAAETVGLDRRDLDLRAGVARVLGKGCLLYTSDAADERVRV